MADMDQISSMVTQDKLEVIDKPLETETQLCDSFLAGSSHAPCYITCCGNKKLAL